ncbi:hypothetical protein [Leucobacter sp. W1038]|uniref:hypothetical protein n=1 Tax=Leucobacter sp. W1038 TaxID=3438281 RepID=UPI003D98B167
MISIKKSNRKVEHAMTTTNNDILYREHFRDHRGRVLVGNSLTSYESATGIEDAVVLGASFAGRPTGILPVRQGARGWIAHEAGPGKDEAGIAGLPLSDEYNVPAAAIATAEARLSGGETLLTGRVSRVNETAAALGVTPGMTGEEAAKKMLDAPLGRVHDIEGVVDESVRTVLETDTGSVFTVWSSSRIDGDRSRDVLVVASHGAKVMALYALRTNPKGIICNDAGFGLDNSGVEGLAELDDHDVAGATVSTESARIGDPESTYQDGIISAVNRAAEAKGVRVGQTAVEAAALMVR